MELFPDYEHEPNPNEGGPLRKTEVPYLEPKPFPIAPDLARELLAKTEMFRQLAPWSEICEDDLFGIRDSETGELNLVSVLGSGGEVFALQCHFPPEGTAFWQRALRGIEPNLAPGLVDVRLIECCFERVEEATPEDIAFVKNHSGLTISTPGVPCFRSYRPGFFPWYLEEREAEQMSLVFDLFFRYYDEVYPNYDKYYQWGETPDDAHYLPVFSYEEGIWKLSSEVFSMRTAFTIREVPPRDPNIEKWQQFEVSDEAWEITTFFIPDPIFETERPYFAKAAICLLDDENADMPIPVTPVLYGVSEMDDASALRQVLASVIEKQGYLPGKIKIDSEEARLAFLSLSDARGVELSFEPLIQTDRFVDTYYGNPGEGLGPGAEEVADLIEHLPPELQAKLHDGDFNEVLDFIMNVIGGESPPNNIVDFNHRNQ